MRRHKRYNFQPQPPMEPLGSLAEIMTSPIPCPVCGKPPTQRGTFYGTPIYRWMCYHPVITTGSTDPTAAKRLAALIGEGE